MEILSRLLGDQVDRAAGGVATVERALGPAQHLDALEVQVVDEGGARAAEVNAVDVERDPRVAAWGDVLVADSAEADLGVGEHHAEGEVGHRELEVAGALDASALEVVGAECGDRRCGLLGVGLALLGGDRDLLDRGAGGRWRRGWFRGGLCAQATDEAKAAGGEGGRCEPRTGASGRETGEMWRGCLEVRHGAWSSDRKVGLAGGGRGSAGRSPVVANAVATECSKTAANLSSVGDMLPPRTPRSLRVPIARLRRLSDPASLVGLEPCGESWRRLDVSDRRFDS